MLPLLLLLVASVVLADYDEVEPSHFCERYVECAAVATLEERLCLGNTLNRPYWLPESTDKNNCHEKLRNDYMLLEKMEEDLDTQLTACLLQNTQPFSDADRQKCDAKTLRSASRFSFERTIDYVPTICFTGTERRIERECGQVRECCPALSRCSHMSVNSPQAKELEEARVQMRQRAENCEKGLPIAMRPLPTAYDATNDYDPNSAPSGHLNVHFRQAGNDYVGKPIDDNDGAAGYINVHIAPKQRSRSYDGIDGVFGQVSEPVPDGERYSRVKFPDPTHRQVQPNARLTEEKGSLTLSNRPESSKERVVDTPRPSHQQRQGGEDRGFKPTSNEGSPPFSSRPRLTFPDDKRAIATRDGVVVVNLQPKPKNAADVPSMDGTLGAKPKLPTSVKSHEVAFEHALQNTNKYKPTSGNHIGDVAREAIDSLLNAGQASAKALTGDMAPSEALFTGHIEAAGPKASGELRPVQVVDDSENNLMPGDFVTTWPVIFVGDREWNRKLSRSGACVERIMKAQTHKLKLILTLLGEKKNSDDMHEIKDLIDHWHNKFRHKVVSAKEKTTRAEIAAALEELITQFDRVNLELIKSQVNATFDEDDYPDEDADVFESKCDPLLVNQIMEETLKQQEHLEKQRLTSMHKFHRTNVSDHIDEHGNHVVVEDGKQKVLMSNEDEKTSLNVDSKSASVEKDENVNSAGDAHIIHNWSNDEYKRELENYKKTHRINATAEVRNETSCDLYMRCRNQMHLAVDSCAWRFASTKILPTLAESAESLLYKAEELCNPADQPVYEELYELMIKRNTRLRTCLHQKNEVFFSSSICLPYSSMEHLIYASAFLRLLSEDYKQSRDCFRDANLIQQKCSKLRECCPNFDECRQETMDTTLEQAIISKTAQLNESKQSCLRSKAREAFKNALRGLLGKGGLSTLRSLRRGQLGRDVALGAHILARYR